MSTGSEKDTRKLPNPSTKQIVDLLTFLGLPEPALITPFAESTGTYHSIYFISFPSSSDIHCEIQVSEYGTKDLILRVSGLDFPRIKTTNEVAVMNWVRRNTSIPLPFVVASSSTTDNPLGHEYTLLERCRGVVLSDMADDLSSEEEREILDQIGDYLSQLYSQSWDHIGGLQQEGQVFIPGPMVGEQFWHAWDSNFDDPLSLNPFGPFSNLSSCFADQIIKFQKTIEVHPELASVRDLPIPQLLSALQEPLFTAKLSSSIRYILAHRDLHFRNILYCRETHKITSVIDWELAAVVPYPLWNPGGFLWNGREDASTDKEQARMTRLYRQVVYEKGLQSLLEEEKWQNVEQQTVQDATVMLKRIVNGRVRGWEKNKVSVHRERFEKAVNKIVEFAKAESLKSIEK